jgi:hypothetical protein
MELKKPNQRFHLTAIAQYSTYVISVPANYVRARLSDYYTQLRQQVLPLSPTGAFAFDAIAGKCLFQSQDYHNLNLLNEKFKVFSPHGFDMGNTGLIDSLEELPL